MDSFYTTDDEPGAYHLPGQFEIRAPSSLEVPLMVDLLGIYPNILAIIIESLDLYSLEEVSPFRDFPCF